MANTRSVRFFLWGAAALVAAILALMLFAGQNRPAQVSTLVSIGAPFKLASSRGGELDSAELKGKAYGLFFGFTHCPEVCPTTLNEMSATLQELGGEAKDFRFLFVTVDPERDTPAALADYVANFDPRIEGLSPTPMQLEAVAKAFHVYYKKVPTSGGDYTMDHTAIVMLFDRAGSFAGTLAFDEEKSSRLAKLKKLLAGS